MINIRAIRSSRLHDRRLALKSICPRRGDSESGVCWLHTGKENNVKKQNNRLNIGIKIKIFYIKVKPIYIQCQGKKFIGKVNFTSPSCYMSALCRFVKFTEFNTCHFSARKSLMNDES